MIDYDDVVSACDAHGITLPVEAIEATAELANMFVARALAAHSAGAKEPVGHVTHDDANGWDFQPTVDWTVLGKGRALYAQPPAATDAARDVLAERRRQVEVEGWAPEHDDEHDDCEMALAAIVYAESAVGYWTECPDTWPWHPKWFKPTTPRRDLVKAGALILAEIERLDRFAEIDRGEEIVALRKVVWK